MKLSNSVVTMSSREIASLTGSNHSDVRRSIERLSEANLLSQPLADTPYINEQNRQTYYEYHLNKRDSLVVVVRLSPEFTAVVVDRWQELEHKSQVPQSLPEALRLAADLAEEKQQLENQLSIAAPKVEFVDRYVKANGSMTFRQVAKLLNAKEHEFNCFLLDQHIMYRLNGALTPRQQHSALGRFEVKTGTNTLNNHAFAQSRFTPKGVKWVGGLWAEYLAKKGAA
jgi:phage antirepressor YoqD-like protein